METHQLPQLKVILLGQENTGKTCLLHRYNHGIFMEVQKPTSSIGGSFFGKLLEVDGTKIKLAIWDTAGAEKFKSMTRVYYKGASAAIVCYDLSEVSTFEKAAFWINELQTYEEKCKIYICGTKRDLLVNNTEDASTMRTIYEYARDVNAQVFQTSSLLGYNIENLFMTIARDFVAEETNLKPRTKDGVIVPGVTDSHEDDKKSGCCTSKHK